MPIRRVVTGTNAEGKSVVISDGLPTNVVLPIPFANDLKLINLWKSSDNLLEDKDPTNELILLEPKKNETIFRIVNIPPDESYIPKLTEQCWERIGIHRDEKSKNTHPMMHKTHTLDYSIILSGNITLLLDDSEVDLKAGDVVIQQATHHAWSNRSNELAQIAFVLIPVKE